MSSNYAIKKIQQIFSIAQGLADTQTHSDHFIVVSHIEYRKMQSLCTKYINLFNIILKLDPLPAKRTF